MAQAPLKKNERSKVINLRVLSSMEQALNAAAEERETTRSELVRGLIEDFIAKNSAETKVEAA